MKRRWGGLFGPPLAAWLACGAWGSGVAQAAMVPTPEHHSALQATPAPRPYPPLAPPVHLPALSRGGVSAPCDSEIVVQSVGDEPSKAVLLTWGGDADCATCPGPVSVTCSGLMAPGSTWHFEPLVGADEATSGAVFSFNLRTLDEIGATPGGEAIVADHLCAALTSVVGRRCEPYRAFREAYDSGDLFAGVPLRLAYGAPMAAHVTRDCPGDREKLVRARAGYNGFVASGGSEDLLPYTSYHALPMSAGTDGATTTLHIQNRGTVCASVEVLFQPADACQIARPCGRAFTIAPGASASLPGGALCRSRRDRLGRGQRHRAARGARGHGGQ